MAVVHVTNETFEKEVMQAEGKVLVDFWASWCGTLSYAWTGY